MRFLTSVTKELFYHLCESSLSRWKRPHCSKQTLLLRTSQGTGQESTTPDGESTVPKMGGTPSVPKTNAPLRACIHTIQNRPGQFDDPAAIEQQLPIASGQIESSHRHLIQKRLKLPGGAGGNWSMQTPCSLPGLPEKSTMVAFCQQHTPE